MSAIDNSLQGQPTTKRPGGKPEGAERANPMPANDQPFGPQADDSTNQSDSTRKAPGVTRDDKTQGVQPGRQRSDADPLGDNTEYTNGAGSSAS